MRTKEHLTETQNKVIDFCCTKKRCGLFLGTGNGKTVITLSAFMSAKNKGLAKKGLVVAPKSVVAGQWQNEIKKWGHLKDLKVVPALGSREKQIKALETEADIHVIGYSMLTSFFKNKTTPQPTPTALKNWGWDFIILDEATKVKSSSTAIWKILKNRTKNAKYLVLLTATPSPNGVKDLWSQIYLIDRGERLGKAMTYFLEEYGSFHSYKKWSWAPLPYAVDLIKEKLKDICLSIEDKDIQNLMPKTVYIDKTYPLSNEQKKVIRSIKTGVTTFEDNVEILSVEQVTKLTKIIQVESGFMYLGDKRYREIDSTSLKVLSSVIEKRPDDNFLIVYNFIADCERLLKWLPGAVKYSNQEDIDLWNSGEIKYFLIHPKSAGLGLNLQYGGNTIIWFGLTWSLEEYLQTNGRLSRPGQKNKVEIIRIFPESGAGSTIAKVLTAKDKTQNEILSYLKKQIL